MDAQQDIGTAEWISGPGGTEFYTKRWEAQNPKAHVVFVHGLIEHVWPAFWFDLVQRYNYFFTSLAGRGISTFAFDQRGWGRTGQKSNTEGITSLKHQLEDLEFFLQREIELCEPLKVFLFGHSMGGGIVMQYACAPSISRPSLSRVSGIISSSPITIQPREARVDRLTLYAGAAIGKVLPSLQIKIDIKGTDLAHDEAVVQDYVKDPLCPPIASYRQLADMLFGGEALLNKAYRNYPNQLSLLVYHGTEDKVTWCEASRQLVEKIDGSDKQFIAYEGYFHECHNEPGAMKEKVIEDVCSWILERA